MRSSTLERILWTHRVRVVEVIVEREREQRRHLCVPPPMGLILKSLAPYTGPYPVSTHDVELAPFPSRSRSEFSRARLVSNGQRALSLDSVLFTVFYPTSEDSDNRSKPMPWLERPLSVTARGYAKFLAKPKIVVQALVYAFGAGLHLATRGTDLPVVRLDKPAPVVVFSHGLSGNRTTYSSVPPPPPLVD